MADESKEFARNFERCFVSVKMQNGSTRAFYVRGTDSYHGGVTISGSIVTASYKETPAKRLWAETGFCTPIIPAAGYFNVQVHEKDKEPWVTALRVGLTPERQFRKGLAGDDYIITHLLNHNPHFADRWTKLEASARGDTIFVNKVLAHHLAQGLGRELTSVREAAEMVESGKHQSVAFSRYFAVQLRASYASPTIIHNDRLVGVYSLGRIYAEPSVLHLKDFFQKRWGIEMIDINARG